MSRDLLLVLAGPSGGGKTTVCRKLVAQRPEARFSLSVTTRRPRRGERDGVDYRFVTRDEFESLIASDELLEWAEVHGELYGTPRISVAGGVGPARATLLDIDVQGARQVRTTEPDAVLVFLLPPSADAMLERLRKRGSESSEELRRRLRTAQSELAAVQEFDYVVVNEDLERTVRVVDAILEAESHRTVRYGPALEALTKDVREALAVDYANSNPRT